MNPAQVPTIVIFGRTGSGKSALGNMILHDTEFKEGNTLQSETKRTQLKAGYWQKNPSLKICVVDTPGLADINAERGPEIILQDILEFLCMLKDGFNIAIYCMASTKLRFDKYDKDELEVMGTLLGHDVFSHTFIALTQVDRLDQNLRWETIQKFCRELPPILEKEVFLEGFSDKILISDFTNFEPFLSSLDKLLKTCPSYYPKIADEIDIHDPSSIKSFLTSPPIQEIIRKYEEIIEDQYSSLMSLNRQVQEKAIVNKIYQKQIENREKELQELQDIHYELQSIRSDPNPGLFFFPHFLETNEKPQKILKKSQNVSSKEDHRLKGNRSGDGLNIDGTLDHRLKENRIKGFNMDGSLDKRFSKNKTVQNTGGKDKQCESKIVQNFNSVANDITNLLKIPQYVPTPIQNMTASGPLKKDGTLDLRYSVNKQASNPITTAYIQGPVKKDGTPDMRYAVNKQAASSMTSTHASTGTGKTSSGTSGHGGKSGGTHASAGGGKSSIGCCSASSGSGGKSGGGKSHK